MDLQKILLTDLIPNDYNPNEMPKGKLEQLKKTIKASGYWQFIIARPHPEEKGKYTIIDGEHRWQAMKDEPEFQDPQYVIVTDSDADMAKLQTINFNLLRGEMDSVKIAGIIHDLMKTHTVEEIEANLGMSQEEITSYNEMADYDFDAIGELEDVADEIDNTRLEEQQKQQVMLEFSPDDKKAFDDIITKVTIATPGISLEEAVLTVFGKSEYAEEEYKKPMKTDFSMGVDI